VPSSNYESLCHSLEVKFVKSEEIYVHRHTPVADPGAVLVSLESDPREPTLVLSTRSKGDKPSNIKKKATCSTIVLWDHVSRRNAIIYRHGHFLFVFSYSRSALT
jgi:hypothetical protein